jgi:hypothetical protein
MPHLAHDAGRAERYVVAHDRMAGQGARDVDAQAMKAGGSNDG